MRYTHHGNLYRLEAAIEVEIEASELADAEFIVDADAGMDYFAGVAAGFEAVFGFEEFDLRGVFFGGGGRGLFCRLLGFLAGGRECAARRHDDDDDRVKDSRKGGCKKAQGVLRKILGTERATVKNWFCLSFRGIEKAISPGAKAPFGAKR